MKYRIQGETYADAGELIDTIGRLTAEMLEMADGPERVALLEHIERLQTALGPEVESEGNADDAPAMRDRLPEPDPAPASSGELDEVDRELLEHGAKFACPMCDGVGELTYEPPQDPNAERCADCDGWGKVYTGSRVPGYEVEDCRSCKGEGRVREPVAEYAAIAAPAKAAEFPGQLGALWDGENSAWLPPPGQQPPWVGATWDSFYGKWA